MLPADGPARLAARPFLCPAPRLNTRPSETRPGAATLSARLPRPARQEAVLGHRICPWWLGYWLVNPVRRLVENPVRMLATLVRPGMVVLEPGCGMGYFTLDLARMVGDAGRVVAVDVQERMLAGLRRRARRAGLLARIDARLASPSALGVTDLDATVDVALALHVVHEVPVQGRFFAEVRTALRPGGALLVVEPRGHVGVDDFRASLAAAVAEGCAVAKYPFLESDRAALLTRAD